MQSRPQQETTAVSSLSEQQAIRRKCVHPSGAFVEFKKAEIEQAIPERFETIVRMHPHRLAIKTKTQSLTYETLNQIANRVARAIIAKQGSSNEPIALLLDQDISLIAAIIGVLKSGNIYVSLDPFHASARTGYIVDDTGTRLIVTDSKNASQAENLARNGCQVLNLDEIDSRVSAENIGLSLLPEALAYIVYTSGSTGQPKGVVQSHRNLLHACKSYTNGLHISINDRLSLLHSCSFNGSVYNLFGALLNGAALLPFDLREEGVHQLAQWLGHNEISIYHSSPTTFRHAAKGLTDKERFPNLRVIHLSGAAASNEDVELYKKHFSQDCIFVHRMGVTETGTIRWYFVDQRVSSGGTRVPIGYPSDQKKVLLLDESGAEVGDNCIGEIAVKSCFLSLGYWRKPELTLAKFLAQEGENRKVYLTGDLGRMTPDGCLFHLGRKDSHVKVRGYSVEVEEVERALIEYPGIKEVAVAGRESEPGDKRLVAYLVSTGPAAGVTALRNFLKGRLPDYMIPSAFVVLSALPRTPNDRVDRSALPAPEDRRPDLDCPMTIARTPVERELADIWADVLKIDQVGIHDNFFDLGGHSLSATRIISQVIKNFQLEIPIHILFESPTIAELAKIISRSQTEQVSQEELSRILSELGSLSEDQSRQLSVQEQSGEVPEKIR